MKPQKSASIQGKPTLITFTGRISIIDPAITSTGKLPKEADNKLVQGTVKEKYYKKKNVFEYLKTLICPLYTSGTSQMTDKDCSQPEDQGLEAMVDDRTKREIIPMPPFTFQFSMNLNPWDLKDMDQVLCLHQLPKYLFQWNMDNKRFNLASHWAELGAGFKKICLKDVIVITKGWNPNRQSKPLEERAARIRENQGIIQAIEEQLN
ncbi:hypothetical protein O181_061157 [Austropuccinia psidii MF-1]|uniref:Uncharacterized protein n=1 Tax=Austropuccinia psidii MF-1 TaxID=1389203 RepID=A0A9Q3HZ35_9BASI|nr:hypothetical protein [Austropuccinia psidii MF-1]